MILEKQLIEAVKNGNENTVKMLIEAGENHYQMIYIYMVLDNESIEILITDFTGNIKLPGNYHLLRNIYVQV